MDSFLVVVIMLLEASSFFRSNLFFIIMNMNESKKTKLHDLFIDHRKKKRRTGAVGADQMTARRASNPGNIYLNTDSGISSIASLFVYICN